MAHFSGTIRNDSGLIVPNATVTITDSGTGTIVTLYSDPGLTLEISNPLIAGDHGEVDFYVPGGTYNILTTRFDIKDQLSENVAILEATATGPVGPAGGDLGATYPNPTVDGLIGILISGVPNDGDILKYNDSAIGFEWAPETGAPTNIEMVCLSAGMLVPSDPGLLTDSSDNGPLILPAGGVTSWGGIMLRLPSNFYGVDLTLRAYLTTQNIGGENIRFRWLFGDAESGPSLVGADLALSGADALNEFVISIDAQVIGSALGDMVVIEVGRDASHANDDNTNNVKFHALVIEPT